MPIDLYYDSKINSMFMKATGRIVYDDLPVLAEQLVNHVNFRKNINQLFDVTEGELDLSNEELKQVSNDFQNISELLGMERRLAIVVSRDLDFGMMRMYEVFFDAGPGVEILVLRSLEKAFKWLKRDE